MKISEKDSFSYNNKEYETESHTIQKGVKVNGLEVFLLPHKAFEGSGPAFAQNLDPLKVKLRNTKSR